MEWERYRLDRSSDELEYEFYSEGPNGRIRKKIAFQPLPELGRHVFNLAFGDFNATTHRIDDKVISNNGDWAIVLHTVTEAVDDFMKRKPLAILLIRGSTPSRIRLYQMGITAFWPKIHEHYEVLGKSDGQWIPYQGGTNFKEFVIFKKIR